MCMRVQHQLSSHIIIVSMCFVGIGLFISYTGPHVAENKIQTVCGTLVFHADLKKKQLKGFHAVTTKPNPSSWSYDGVYPN